MGVTIYANGSAQSFDMGYGGFFNLRKNIALAYDKDFGEHYATLVKCNTKEDFEVFDKIANELLKDCPDEDSDILDFLFAADTDGKCAYKTCKKIADLLRQADLSDKRFVYMAYSDGKDYKHFIDFLDECYKYRRKMRWR